MELFFRANFLLFILIFSVTSFYPLSRFPQGGKALLLPPWGKVGMGVSF